MPLDQDPNANPGDKGQGTDDAPKYVTEEQLNKAITTRLNSALGTFEKKITGSITEAINGLGSTIDKALDDKIAAHLPEGKGAKKADDKGHGDFAEHPAFKGLQKQIEEQKAATAKANAERDAERQKGRDRDLRVKLSDELAKLGVKDPARLKLAVGALVDSEKRVKWADGDDESIVFNDSDGPLDLATGLKGWAKSEDAKIFLSPVSAAGSGDRGGGKAPGANGSGQGYQRGDFGRALLNEVGGMPLMIGPGAKPAAK